LVDTAPEQVPHEFAQAVIDFCKSIDAISEGYVGLTEITVDAQNPYQQLAAAFVLAQEDVEHVQAVAQRFDATMPADVVAGGCNVLDGPGIDVWRKQAQRVFRR
jgi:hypothetical protein